MLSATLDLNFTLPQVHPLEKPMAFTFAQFQRLRNWGHDRARNASQGMLRLLQRIEDLRGTSVAWAAGLSLGDLVTWSVKNAQGSVSSLPAPITIFKPQQHLWVPKVVLSVCPEVQIEPAAMTAYHTTCRRASIEFLAITHEQIADGYLDGKEFKRAFNGAFFCDRLHNTTIFCPTLRHWGFYSWEHASHMDAPHA